jgi:DNA-binding response OmpR family regulator
LAKDNFKLLIIEDDLDIADMLNAYFRVQGYEVFISNWGEDGVRAVANFKPDLVLLDIRLPDIDGYEVARRLRTDRKTKNVPIIFLTEKRDRSDRLQGLEIGADDYITKPFDVQELRLRVRNAIKRANQDTLTNPVTGLPEGEIVLEQIREYITKGSWAILLVSLQNVEAFRDQYGFVASDDVIRAVSLMLTNCLSETGSREEFIGHLTATEFLLLIAPGTMGNLGAHVQNRLMQALDYFYPIKDREQVNVQASRLVINTTCISSNEGHFASVDEVRAALYQRNR